MTADYSSYDPTKIDPWLMSVLPELSQYTYAMLRNGMDRTLLSTTTEEELRDVCGVNNGIHRRIIMQHLNGNFFFISYINSQVVITRSCFIFYFLLSEIYFSWLFDDKFILLLNCGIHNIYFYFKIRLTDFIDACFLSPCRFCFPL